MQAIREIVRQVTERAAASNSPNAQTSVVLKEVMQQLGSGAHSLEVQQEILTAFQDLFRSGDFSWGYNVDNPGEPFFHKSRRAPGTGH